MKPKIIHITLAALLTATLTGCSEHEAIPAPDSVVSFSTSVTSESTTRAYSGIIDNETVLQGVTGGFGVFGYLTENDLWGVAKAKTDKPRPDFMYDQSVYYTIVSVDGEGNETKDWIYTPPKYWPNTTGNGEQYRYVSFFAYAPWVSIDEAAAATSGITALPSDEHPEPRVQYTVGVPGEQPDLLWAEAANCKRTGNGLIVVDDGTQTFQKVPLKFHHALACVDFYVQRLYDEETFTGNKPSAEEHTKLFISKLQLQETSATPKVIYGKGWLSLEDGTWSDSDWEGATGSLAEDKAADKLLTYTEQKFHEAVGGTAFREEGATALQLATIRDSELDKWEKDGYGVDAEERPLFAGTEEGKVYSKPLFFLPQELTLTPTLTFSMVTRDDNLALSTLKDSDGHLYERIVNEVQGTPVTLNLEKGKRYKVLVHVGVESVRFEVVSIEDWDFPLRFTPDVQPFDNEEKEKKLDE